MHETDLELDPNEASDLCRLEAPGLLEQRGWDRAFLTVLDEPPAEECLAVLGHERKAEPGEGWEALRVKCAVDEGGEEDPRRGGLRPPRAAGSICSGHSTAARRGRSTDAVPGSREHARTTWPMRSKATDAPGSSWSGCALPSTAR